MLVCQCHVSWQSSVFGFPRLTLIRINAYLMIAIAAAPVSLQLCSCLLSLATRRRCPGAEVHPVEKTGGGAALHQ